MIEFDSVGKRFAVPPGPGRAPGTVEALRDVSLEIPAGEVWAVVGPNGAGKSTLFALLLGFLHATAGEIRIRGQAPRRYVRRSGAAYLPERFEVPPEWTVRATLTALARLEDLALADARARADAVLERLELGPHADKPAGTLSRGLLQRLGLAQALLAPRELVVLDEPTEGLDPLWRIRLRELVAELRADGRTVLLASHDLAEVERLATRAVLLEDGRVREVLEIAPTGGPLLRYRIEAASGQGRIPEIFPGAVALEDGRPGAVYLVEVPDAEELSRRLAALLEAGAVVTAVRPEAEALEDRVRRALGGGGASA